MHLILTQAVWHLLMFPQRRLLLRDGHGLLRPRHLLRGAPDGLPLPVPALLPRPLRVRLLHLRRRDGRMLPQGLGGLHCAGAGRGRLRAKGLLRRGGAGAAQRKRREHCSTSTAAAATAAKAVAAIATTTAKAAAAATATTTITRKAVATAIIASTTSRNGTATVLTTRKAVATAAATLAGATATAATAPTKCQSLLHWSMFNLVRTTFRFAIPGTGCFEDNVEYEGETLDMVVLVPSAAECQRLCAEYPGCAYFSYAKDSPPRCWLKGPKALRNSKENESRISGPRTCSGAYRSTFNFGTTRKKRHRN